MEAFAVFNYLADAVGKRADYALVDLVVQRMWDDPVVFQCISAMHAGEDLPPPSDYPFPPPASLPLLDPQQPCTDIDIARVESVCSMNAFRIQPETGSSAQPKEEDTDHLDLDTSTALYELPSFCNHACLPSGSRVFFGDAMVVRASRDLSAGEEVSLSYRTNIGSTDEERAVFAKRWGFTCACLVCKAELADSADARRQRAASPQSLAQSSGIEAALRRVEIIKASYADTPERRLCRMKLKLFWAYHGLAFAYEAAAANARTPLSTSAQIKSYLLAEMDALEALGMVVIDRSVSGTMPNTPSGLPVDMSRPPVDMADSCTAAIVQMLGAWRIIREEKRLVRWLKVAVWSEWFDVRLTFGFREADCCVLFIVEELFVGGGKDLFLEKYRELLPGMTRHLA